MSKEAMKRALEALGQLWLFSDEAAVIANPSITALREALAEQGPAKYDCCANCMRPQHEHNGNSCPKPYTTVWHAWDYDFSPYPAPAAKPAQEKDWGAVGEAHIAALKKSSKAMVEDAAVRAVHKVMAEFEERTWVGLTDDEKAECASPYDSRLCCVEATEAKLKEKNT